MQRPETTITEDLLAYKEHMKRWPKERDMDYADAIGQSYGWISNFSRYWNAIDGGVISKRLHRVILLHNDRKKHRCEDPLVFNKVVFKETLKLRCPRWSKCQVEFGPSEQDDALHVALGKPVDDATDEALLQIRYSVFERALAQG